MAASAIPIALPNTTGTALASGRFQLRNMPTILHPNGIQRQSEMASGLILRIRKMQLISQHYMFIIN